MDSDRFNRLEERVDEIRDNVADLKAESKLHNETTRQLRNEIHAYTSAVKDHVSSDNKIINQVKPLLESLPEIKILVDDSLYRKRKNEEMKQKFKDISLKLGIVSATVGILYGVIRLFSYLA